MNIIINFLKNIDILSFIHKMDAGTLAALILVIIFGIPFAAMIVYAIVLHRRGKKMGVIYDHSKKIDDEFWEINRCSLGPTIDTINHPPL